LWAAGPQGQRVRLICVPRFSSSGTLLLVNLTTLKVQPITFDARMDL
jgi:DNA polymerase II small subunit/DNA polymerase delta subunit B